MASAGRILIMPKGNYDSSVSYEMLDMVYYNGTSWLAKKAVKGIEPSVANSEYWHKFIDLGEILSNYLTLDGGDLRGQLRFGNGLGAISADEYASYLTAFEDNDNYRLIRIVNPSVEDDINHLAQVGSRIDGELTVYNLFGEHNIDYLKQLLGLA